MLVRLPGFAFRSTQRIRLAVALLCLMIFAAGICSPATAQQQGVELTVSPTDIGLEGHVHPGNWVPVRLRLVHQASTARDVICRFIYKDRDGDSVAAQRAIVLNPTDELGTPQITWLYGHPQDSTNPSYRFDVVDAATNTVLASVEQSPLSIRPRGSQFIGVCGPSAMGLDARQNQPSLHEPFTAQTNLSLTSLPDHWLGYSQLSALIWTPRDVDPTDASVSPAVLNALREWVYRGGRFVVVLPDRNQSWTQLPAWSEAMPVTGEQIKPSTASMDQLVRFLGAAKTTNSVQIPVNHFSADTQGTDPPGTLLRGSDGRIYAATARHGFGSVTLIGIDLTQPVLAQLGLPQGRGDWPFWNLIFGFRTPVLDPDLSDRYERAGYQTPAGRLQLYGLGGIIQQNTAMTGQVAAGLTAAVVLFAAYFLMAGVLMDRTLRKKKLNQHGWIVFSGLTLVFTLVAWSGAWGLSQHKLTARHLSVVDIDAATDTARVHSWASVLTPGFGLADFQIHTQEDLPLAEQWQPVLYNPSPDTAASLSGYLDPQTYTFDLSQTDQAQIPSRATVKQIAMNYTGPLTMLMPGLKEPIDPTRGFVRYTQTSDASGSARGSARQLVGEIKHQLPSALEDVVIIFCPGAPDASADDTTALDRRQPWVWSPPTGKWEPGQALDLTMPKSAMQLVAAPQSPGRGNTVDLPVLNASSSSSSLADLEEASEQSTRIETRPMTRWDQRSPGRNGQEGYLGLFVTQPAGQPIDTYLQTLAQDSSIHAEILRLSLFDRMPPPIFRLVKQEVLALTPPSFAYARVDGHRLDMSHLLNEPRLIVLGHLRHHSLPVPLTIDGDTIHSDGHTVFRYIFDLKQP